MNNSRQKLHSSDENENIQCDENGAKKEENEDIFWTNNAHCSCLTAVSIVLSLQCFLSADINYKFRKTFFKMICILENDRFAKDRSQKSKKGGISQIFHLEFNSYSFPFGSMKIQNISDWLAFRCNLNLSRTFFLDLVFFVKNNTSSMMIITLCAKVCEKVKKNSFVFSTESVQNLCPKSITQSHFLRRLCFLEFLIFHDFPVELSISSQNNMKFPNKLNQIAESQNFTAKWHKKTMSQLLFIV